MGANDGIVSTAGMVVGVAGAAVSSGALLASGVAAVVAGAISMAVGEYVSVSSQRDSQTAELARERTQLESDPEGELKELSDSESMVPALTPRERLLTRRPRASRAVLRGDVVVVRSAELGRVIVKRVVGLPQEDVSFTASEVRVNGMRLPEPCRATAAAGGSRTCLSLPCADLCC